LLNVRLDRARRFLAGRRKLEVIGFLLCAAACPTCKSAGGCSTDFTDYPDERTPYAQRWPDYYRKRARELGSAAGDFTDHLLAGEFPWSRLRQAQKLLRLAERYGAARLDAACRRALDFDLQDVYRVQRILEQGLESQSEPQPIVGQQSALELKFLRPAQHFLSSQGDDHADRS
jgi:hypothetical protein